MTNIVKLKDIKNLPISHNGDEIRFNCPFCITIRGKEDNDGKLEYNEKKRIGHCYKCDTVVIGDQDWSLETASNKLKLKDIDHRSVYNLSGWSDAVTEGSKSYDYLISRKLTKELIEFYQFRESDHFDGIIIPNPISNTDDTYLTNFCQVRYFKSDAKLRYLGIPDSKKPIYGKSLVPDNSKLVICEGVFSAIAANRRLGLPAIALYGKSLSKYQEAEIRSMNPYSIVLILDGKELRDILEIGRRLSFFVKTYAVFLPFGTDPEEAPNLEEDITEHCIEINTLNISKLNEIRYSYRYLTDKWNMCRDFCKRRSR